MSDYPAHGFHCNARTFPMICKYCGRQVFFFSCDHGSKVFFDELGAPWKVHTCVERAIAILGKERIEQEIAERMMSSYMSVDYERYVRFAQKQQQEQPKRREKELVPLAPYPRVEAQEMGIIRELSLEVNLFKKLKVEDTPQWRSALGKLLNEAQAQVTIHTGALGEDDPYSVTFFVKRKIIKEKALTIGDFVECSLVGYPVPGRDTLWMCTALRSAYD